MSAPNLAVNLGPVPLKNPVVTASGTFGYGFEFDDFMDLNRLGGIAVKGLTRHPRPGNAPPRIAETPAGMLNAIGLENVGIDGFISKKLPPLRKLDTCIIANISGVTVDEYVQMSAMLAEAEGVGVIEINVSCPNVKVGGIAFGSKPDMIQEITREVKAAAAKIPVLVKLSPNVTDIVEMADAAMNGGADGLAITNTFLGMAIDAERRRPMLANITGGLSGPAIKPLALRLVWQVHQAMPEVPICGMGGIMSGTDAIEFMLAGASTIAVGTASMINPSAAVDVLNEIEVYCQRQGVNNISDLIGALEI